MNLTDADPALQYSAGVPMALSTPGIRTSETPGVAREGPRRASAIKLNPAVSFTLTALRRSFRTARPWTGAQSFEGRSEPTKENLHDVDIEGHFICEQSQ